MRETKFIDQNSKKWKEFEQTLENPNADPDKLNEVFVQVTDDLSYSRTFYPNRSVRVYLNSIAQKIFSKIYKVQKSRKSRLISFWTDSLPRQIHESKSEMRLAFWVFGIAVFIGAFSTHQDPEFVRSILSDGYVDMTLENIEKGDPMAVYKDEEAFGMALGITFNNLWVDIIAFAFGIFYSIGSIFILLVNGVMVGAFQYFFVTQGESYGNEALIFFLGGITFLYLAIDLLLNYKVRHKVYLIAALGAMLYYIQFLLSGVLTESGIDFGVFFESLCTIWIHGTLEMSAAVIAGAAGIIMGKGLVFPGTLSRLKSFQISARKGVKVLVGILPLTLFAGFLESYVTRHTEIAIELRLLFILFCLAFVVFYYIWYPRYKAQIGFDNDEQKVELSPDIFTKIDTTKIKTFGQVFGETFFLYRKTLRPVFLTALGLVAGYLGYRFGLFDYVSPKFRFGLQMSYLSEKFTSISTPLLPLMTTLMVSFFSLIILHFGHRVIQSDFGISAKQFSWRWLNLLLPAYLIVVIMAYTSYWAIILLVLAVPIIILWMSIIYIEGTNLFTALGATFTYIGDSFSRLLGLGAVLGILSCLFMLILESGIVELLMSVINVNISTDKETSTWLYELFNLGITMWLFLAIYAISLFGYLIMYYNLKEIKEGNALAERVSQIGLKRVIQGMERE